MSFKLIIFMQSDRSNEFFGCLTENVKSRIWSENFETRLEKLARFGLKLLEIHTKP